MLITCKCLNIIAEVKEIERRVNLKKELKLASVQDFDSFFKEEIQEVKILSATRRVPSLIRDKRVGSWIVSHCLNCSVNCFATTMDKRVALANSTLAMTQDAIEHLQMNRDFSPAFQIIVQPVSEDLPKTGSAPTGKLKNVLTSLQHQLRESIRDEVTKTEESIRIFTEDLYEKLEDFQNRATKDHKALAHKIREVHVPLQDEEAGDQSSNTESESRKPDTKKSSTKRRTRKSKKTKKSRALAHPPEETECQDRQTSPCPINAQPKAIETIPPSLDSEGLFYLEGMEDNENNESSKSEGEDDEEGEEEEEGEAEEESESEDSESHDEGIDVHHEQTPSCNIAKSLPVEIPPHPPHVYEDKDEVPIEGIDIAASIKALARSVRGDTVFGELPPPRLSTGI